MKNTRWITIILLVALILVLAVALPAYLYNMPLGPSLDLVQPGAASAGQAAVPVAQANPTPAPAAKDPPPGSTSICGGKGRLNLLLLGESLPESAPRGADAIRLVVVDYDSPWVGILALPPLLWTETPLLDGIEAATLTETYYYAKQPPPQREVTAVRRATKTLAQTILDSFGYPAKKYLTLKEDVFIEMVDTLDGIEVNVLEYVDGTPEGYGIYEPGLQQMDGQRALDYVRLIQPAGQPPDELARIERQNQVILGLRSDLLKVENWDQLPRMITLFFRFLYTNLSAKELNSLNCMLAEVGENITLYEITPEMFTLDSNGAMLPNGDAIREEIQDLLSGPQTP